MKTLSQLNKEALERQRSAVKRMGTRMKARTVKMASRSTLGNTVAWIPFVGASLAVALTLWEIRDLCEGIQDLDELYDELEIDEPIDDNTLLTVCHANHPPD